MSSQWRLRPHQIEAVDSIARALRTDTGVQVAEDGLRAQVVAAPGSGKSMIAASAAQVLHAGRVLVLVPTLDLLVQMAGAWRDAGRRGPMFGVCSLRGEEASGLRCTTDVERLMKWLGDRELVTVFATYASLGLGVVERLHGAGWGVWDLVVVDEAHRTSGALGKPWAAVHDNARLPALRRLYMTATPRLWEVPAEATGGQEEVGPGQLVASMDDEAVFGPVVYRLSLSEAIDRGIVARYQVVCVDIEDPHLQAAELVGGAARSDAVRGARLAALQTAVLKTAAEQGLSRVLTFHYRTSEAEAFSSGLPAVAQALWESNPGVYPRPEEVWAEWLCGEHRPAHRRRVLEEFASGVSTQGALMVRGVLASVRVLGEGVDTRNCDAVVFVDVRGSTVDIVQAVGRALRMQPGEGKVASLVVPVFLGAGELPDEMLASKAYGELVRVLTALRAHDAQAVEQLAVGQAPSRSSAEVASVADGAVSGPAQALLTFSKPRDPAQLAAFISLRVLRPERQLWRRGLQAAIAYRADTGDLRVPYGYRAPDGFPLGVWISEQRRVYAQGGLDEERARQLDEVGMVWSHFDVAFEEGLAAARGWAQEHGHLLAPVDAAWQGYPVGVWLKNQRAVARRQRAVSGGGEAAGGGGLNRARQRALEEVDPAWCPEWSVAWQRCFHLARAHCAAGGTLGAGVGRTVVQGEDLGRWAKTQQAEWDQLSYAQQWLLSAFLGLVPLPPEQRPRSAARRSRAEIWEANLAAARQYRQREGHLEVPRQHVETVDGHSRALGVFIANSRSRRAKLARERSAELSALGMRWV
ncbi:Helicase associated domain protein [Streptomyces sp. NPDC046984]|uniref:DEAD/DEAH box helicase n=1 Tax=Streptomyces sp. NPDC046984 TaxID=3155138 RepID=UPI0033FB100D